MAENLKRLNLENQGKNLAQKLTNKIPIIYASDKFKDIAKIWKIKFNENSKTQAFWNYFPELNHNEMVGFTNLQGNFHIIILKDKEDHPRIQKRMAIITDLLKKKGIEVATIDVLGEDLLTKIFSTLMLGDWASYYLALEYGIDPTPVEIVEDFKKKMEA
jgi:glucose/mannose-6-phosphate isomerase